MTSYREHFAPAGAGTSYDEDQYRVGSFWDLLWALEREVLDRVVEEQRRRSKTVAYLDFACGTGRVISYLEDRCDSARGIDVSAEMLQRARGRVRRAELVQADITRADGPIEGKYDLITAFRFVLNAEPELRRAGLRALAARLRDDRSRLVLNTHGNPLSYKGLIVPLRKALAKRGGDENLLSVRELTRILAEVGLEPVARVGMGILPSPITRRIPRDLALAAERGLRSVPFLEPLGVNQVLVCRRKA